MIGMNKTICCSEWMTCSEDILMCSHLLAINVEKDLLLMSSVKITNHLYIQKPCHIKHLFNIARQDFSQCFTIFIMSKFTSLNSLLIVGIKFYLILFYT